MRILLKRVNFHVHDNHDKRHRKISAAHQLNHVILSSSQRMLQRNEYVQNARLKKMNRVFLLYKTYSANDQTTRAICDWNFEEDPLALSTVKFRNLRT